MPYLFADELLLLIVLDLFDDCLILLLDLLKSLPRDCGFHLEVFFAFELVLLKFKASLCPFSHEFFLLAGFELAYLGVFKEDVLSPALSLLCLRLLLLLPALFKVLQLAVGAQLSELLLTIFFLLHFAIKLFHLNRAKRFIFVCLSQPHDSRSAASRVDFAAEFLHKVALRASQFTFPICRPKP